MTRSPDRPGRIANCAGWLWDRFSGLRDALAGPVDVVSGDYLAEPTLRAYPSEASPARSSASWLSVTVSLHGLEGPWAGRPGFDQTAGSVTGMMLLEGGGEQPRLPPILVVNDYVVPWLAQAGVVAALRRRASEGGSWHVHVSLTRVIALWILSLGLFDRDWAHATADSTEEHRYLDPETFTAAAGLGAYQGVTDQVAMSATPGRYDPVLVARGSSERSWR